MSTIERRTRRHHHQQQQQQHDVEQHQEHTDAHINDDQETPVDYLNHNNATTLIKDSVRVLLANRPDDPIQFLADFFAPRSSGIDNAYDKLSWTHYSMPVYQRNALEVYDCLVSLKNEDSQLMGLLGVRFNELLYKLTLDLPKDFSDMTYKRIRTRDDLVVSFNRFYHNVLLLHVMKDFIEVVKAMHKDLDVQDTGKVSQGLCLLVIDRLFDSFTQSSMKETFDKSFSKRFLENADAQLLDDKNSMNERNFVKGCIMRLLDNSLK